jgi:hypothetical protein
MMRTGIIVPRFGKLKAKPGSATRPDSGTCSFPGNIRVKRIGDFKAGLLKSVLMSAQGREKSCLKGTEHWKKVVYPA